ncbi:MAG: alpha-glucan family phosphorylase [Candidatus Neomarinimicrobiota bacterium]
MHPPFAPTVKMIEDLTQLRYAYFSLELGLSEDIPTYSGGLGVLAGDHVKSAADLNLPLCAVTILYREGYLQQRIGLDGWQTERYPRFNPEQLLGRLPVLFTLPLRGRGVYITAWRYDVVGLSGGVVPVFFLDTDIPENLEDDREITRRLYSGGEELRLLQEGILGFGGMRLLEELGVNDIKTYHLNEGHTAFLVAALYNRWQDEQMVRDHCVFTTHTPVSAGHDSFPRSRVTSVLDSLLPDTPMTHFSDDRFAMTELALRGSRAATGVSRLHREVAQKMFPDYKIDYVTNGVHHLSWTTTDTRNLFDEHLPGWREQPDKLRAAGQIPDKAVWSMHRRNKRNTLQYTNAATQLGLSSDLLTVGFARRVVDYKRAYLLFLDPERLTRICSDKVQFIFAGKAHPDDASGKQLIKEIVKMSQHLSGRVQITYLENYNIWLGRLLVSGVDVWLNTPRRPQEASGTSGMKAALNGIINVSILDGWWAEACRHGENGWAIGDPNHPNDETDADHLYALLEEKVIPTYYDNRQKWIHMMKESIVTSADYTSHRMVEDYNRCYYHYAGLGRNQVLS